MTIFELRQVVESIDAGWLIVMVVVAVFVGWLMQGWKDD